MKLRELLLKIEIETLYDEFQIKSLNRTWTLIDYCRVEKKFNLYETNELNFRDDIKEICNMTVYEYAINHLGNEEVLCIERNEFSSIIDIIID